MDKAVVLVSGGLNSAVAASVAREQYELAAKIRDELARRHARLHP